MLSHLNIFGVRNISEMQLALHPRFNFFYGPNGAGKTSVLEAIYVLSSGYSFRTRETAPLVQQGKTALTVYSKTHHQDSVSVQKSLSGATQVRRNQQPCIRASELAHFLPCQLFYQDLFYIIDAGPSTRRATLDWGLFHVEPHYHEIWKTYRDVLKQRNALLRQKAKHSHFLPWDKRLVELAYALDALRSAYCTRWFDVFQHCLQQLTTMPCCMQYLKGWDRKETGISLAALLEDQFAQDMQRQFTHSGAHQADILLMSSTLKARQNLSRGQQKIVLIALKLAQAQLLSVPCVFLMDDITVELDAEHVQRLLTYLASIPGQFFLTTVSAASLSGYEKQLEGYHFTLQQGQTERVHAQSPNECD